MHFASILSAEQTKGWKRSWSKGEQAFLSFRSPFCAHPVKEWEKRSAALEQWQKLRFMTLTSSFYSFVQRFILASFTIFCSKASKNRCKCFLPLKCLLLYWIHTTSVLSGYQYFMAMYLASLLVGLSIKMLFSFQSGYISQRINFVPLDGVWFSSLLFEHTNYKDCLKEFWYFKIENERSTEFSN